MGLFLGFLLSALLIYHTSAYAAYDRVVTWSDMSTMDLRPAFRTPYASDGNLMEAAIPESATYLALRDADSRVNPAFHVPADLKSPVTFWLKIYTEYTTQHIVIFDSHHPEIVFDVLDFRELSAKARNRVVYEIVSKQRVKKSLATFRRAFQRLISNPHPKNPTREEKIIMAAYSKLPHKHSYKELAGFLRSQTGQRDNIVKGLLAAEAFFPKMEQIFKQMNLPIELTRIPLVESSFNLNAKSRVGAAGVWQFMPRSGKEYMHVAYASGIDERLSPLKATVAAAKLLKRNFNIVGNWPLAITAYNHGHGGLPRLDDEQAEDFKRFGHLFRACKATAPGKKNLGWAGRNYYSEFLAVVHAEAYRNLFYGEPPKSNMQPLVFKRLNGGKTAVQIASEHRVSIQDFELYNPDVIDLHRKLPTGFWIALPGETDDLAGLIAPKRPRSRTRST